jgi:hypothetical protein
VNVDLGDAISALALLLSIVATVTTLRFNARQKSLIASQEKLNQVLLEKEALDSLVDRSAELSANLVRVGDGKWRVKVFNRGRSAARNVTIEPADGSELLMKQDVESKFPLESLEPQQGVDLIALVFLGSQSKHPTTLRWDDDAGSGHEKTVYLTY